MLWERTSYQGKVYDHRHRKNTYASATPVTDGRLLYAYFGSEGLYCYDLSGKLRWSKSLGNIGTIGMGNGTSPVLFREKIIVLADQEFDGQGSFLVALHKETGEELWRVDRRNRVTWSTPLLVAAAGRTELVVAGAEANISYDPDSGREIWQARGLVRHAIPSPVTDLNAVFLSAGSQDKQTIAVKLGGSGDLTGSEKILWEYSKGSAYVPSPIYCQGYFYLLADNGIVTCLNPRNGEVVYEGGRMPSPGSVKASPVAFEGKILISNENGQSVVIRAGPRFEVLQTNSVEESVWASPAVSNGRIFIRGQRHLFAIGHTAEETSPPGNGQ
jgi:outer membrane protein assembly factor BamB